jgi:hypothetical protein
MLSRTALLIGSGLFLVGRAYGFDRTGFFVGDFSGQTTCRSLLARADEGLTEAGTCITLYT